MSLKDDEQQNIQMELDFSSALTGEAREAGREETESSGAMNGTENPASTNRLMEEVCERENLKAALRRVKANKGSPGVDGMTVIGIKDYLKQHWPAIREQLLSGTYEPKPVRRVEIAKPDGWCVDLDLEKFFDRVNHDKLMGQIAKRVEDKRLLKLIRAFLNAGVMENGLVSPSVEGAPQGGPLSPLLSNLVLDEFDRELERRGLRFARYADDCNIYVRSERAGQRVMKSITRFITKKLKLKVNETKSAVARPQERKFLGFSFTAGPDIRRRIAPKSLERFKQRIREITRRAKGVSIKTTMEELVPYMRGWRGYFGFCETPEVLIALTRWVRLRLRSALWRQWKTPRRRRAALIANGVSEWAARNTAGSGRGPWYLARSRALSTGLSNAHFKSLGLPSLFQAC